LRWGDNMQKHRLGVPLLAVCLMLPVAACLWIPEVRPALTFSPEELPDGQAGLPYDVEIIVAMNATPVGAFGISEGSLPAGLSLEKMDTGNSARISGTPQQTGTYAFTVSVWCYGTNVSGQSGDKSYTLIVGP
jgi:hypothetical protein